MAPRVEFWGTDKPLSAYDIHVDAGRAVGMQVDLMISPVADHEGWRVVAIHAHSQAQKIAHRRATNGTRSAMGAAAILARAEERRGGEECVGTCRSRWSPDH